MRFGLTKEAILELDPDTRAFTLVGAFMGFFALLEEGVNKALAEVLGVSNLPAAIIARNMSFDDKIKTLRTLVNLFIHDKNKADSFDELALRAKKCAEDRNIVAHTAFRRSFETDGVQFFALSANSKLKFPDIDWSIDVFLKHIDTINEIDNGLRSLENRMSLQSITEALMRSPKTPIAVAGLFGLGGHLLRTREIDESAGDPDEDMND
jgi:predicted O-linked N-acetylglucosamine transferase (SPINDLY family)